jgi:putative NADPH-quinone reductase
VFEPPNPGPIRRPLQVASGFFIAPDTVLPDRTTLTGASMPKRILIIDGHPDPDPARFCHALAEAYAAGAVTAGHEVRRIAVAGLDFPLLRTAAEFRDTPPTGAVRRCQDDVVWAQHLLIVYPLWLGTMPALLKAFFEQVLRPGFAFAMERRGWRKNLRGRSARIVVTIGMPALVYRWYFGAHGLKGLERNILGFVGIGPLRETLIGMVEAASDAKRSAWLDRLRRLGAEGR